MAEGKRFRKVKTVSLDDTSVRAVVWLTNTTANGNRSELFRRMIEREMWERFGPRWREQIPEIAPVDSEREAIPA